MNEDICIDRLPTGEFITYYKGEPITNKLVDKSRAIVAAVAAMRLLAIIASEFVSTDIKDITISAKDLKGNKFEDWNKV